MSAYEIKNRHLLEWIEEVKTLCKPESVHIVTGSDSEYAALIEKLIANKTLTKLKREGSYLARSNPEDVARVEDRTFICSHLQEQAGPTNNWMAPDKMREKLHPLFDGCMKGRVMYVVPYIMGLPGSPYAKVAVEITDSAYVVANMRIMTRIGDQALLMLGEKSFVRCLHSVGMPLHEGVHDVSWPCNPKETYIAHFPETLEVWSYGSGYGGNALLNKKCFALRLASCMARDEGWLAEHMLIIGLTNPEGVKKYFAASFPSACGKTNLALLQSALDGWKVECVGDDIAWMHWGEDGRLYATNPEAGFFGVAPGTSYKSNPNAMKTIEKNTLFTNVAMTADHDVWWEGMTDVPPSPLIGWTGSLWDEKSGQKAAHPNSRFTASISQCPSVDSNYEAPLGVPISGIIFGGRRSKVMPLVRQATSWEHGVFLGASMTSETTAAAKGEVGKLRHDPFAMLPFCGYNMADYFNHWLNQEKEGRKMPLCFYVNWFLKDTDGNFLWPGFGENIRVLRWMFEQTEGKNLGHKTAVGILPYPDEIGCKKELLEVDVIGWKKECRELEDYLNMFGEKLPLKIKEELHALQRAFS